MHISSYYPLIKVSNCNFQIESLYRHQLLLNYLFKFSVENAFYILSHAVKNFRQVLARKGDWKVLVQKEFNLICINFNV